MSDGLSIPNPPKFETLGSYQAFGLTPTFGDVFMLEVRLKTGRRIGLPYPWLGEVLYDQPRLSMTFTTGATVVLEGVNLGELFEALLRHQAVYVQEADRPTKELVSLSVPVIESIVVSTGGKPPPVNARDCETLGSV